MYNHYSFERAARKRRNKALLFTFLFHLALIGGIACMGAGGDWQDQLPTAIQEWLGLEQPEPALAIDPETPQP